MNMPAPLEVVAMTVCMMIGVVIGWLAGYLDRS